MITKPVTSSYFPVNDLVGREAKGCGALAQGRTDSHVPDRSWSAGELRGQRSHRTGRCHVRASVACGAGGAAYRHGDPRAGRGAVEVDQRVSGAVRLKAVRVAVGARGRV